MNSKFTESLLSWYTQNARQLPWRGHSDPYAIWVSEIMLQQTRVDTVIPYFERWMRKFPDIFTLAAASQEEVLSQWEGLGYYSRARNLHRSAQIVVNEYENKLPEDAKQLDKLPGVGRYTAGAIASLAFGRDEAVLDGNIRRVLARINNVELPEGSPAGERRFWELARINLPTGKAADYNQAMMDLGATICIHQQPKCSECPVNSFCQAIKLNNQEARPVRAKRPPIPHHIVSAAVIQRQGQVLIARRPGNGLLGGLWEFPGGKQQPGENIKTCLQREIREELGVEISVGNSMGVYQHAYTHFRITLHAFQCSLVGSAEPQHLEHTALDWVSPQDLTHFPMGKVDRQITYKLREIIHDC